VHVSGKDEDRRRRGEENERAKRAADEADDEQPSHRKPSRGSRVGPARQARDELCRKQRHSRGDVGGARVDAGQHQRRKGDKRSAAGEPILHDGPHRGNEEDDEGGHRDILSGAVVARSNTRSTREANEKENTGPAAPK
jgi:hypothetical protein